MKLAMLLPAPVRARLFVAFGLATRAMTLGVKALVTDGDRVLLVRHTYVPGWHLPGGGVERGETVREAVEKEVAEETNVRLSASPVLFAFYKNASTSRFDHIALFVCREWKEIGAFEPDPEIAACEWFAADALPEGATRATRERIVEVLGDRPPAEDW